MLSLSRPPKGLIFLSFILIAASAVWFFWPSEESGSKPVSIVETSPVEKPDTNSLESVRTQELGSKTKINDQMAETSSSSMELPVKPEKIAKQVVTPKPKVKIKKNRKAKKPKKAAASRFSLLPDYRDPRFDLGRFEKVAKSKVDCRRQLCPHKDTRDPVLMIGLAYVPNGASMKFVNSDRLNLQAYSLSK